jgi:hypothetical protein
MSNSPPVRAMNGGRDPSLRTPWPRELRVSQAPWRIVACQQVADALGGQFLAWRDAPFPDRFRCALCGEADTLSRGFEAGLSLVEHPGAIQIVLHHLRCAPSQVVRGPGTLRGPGTGAPNHADSLPVMSLSAAWPARPILSNIPGASAQSSLFTTYLIDGDVLSATSSPSATRWLLQKRPKVW